MKDVPGFTGGPFNGFESLEASARDNSTLQR
jgi:hypothetical protein